MYVVRKLLYNMRIISVISRANTSIVLPPKNYYYFNFAESALNIFGGIRSPQSPPMLHGCEFNTLPCVRFFPTLLKE